MPVGKAKWPQIAEMRASGMSISAIAEALGCTRQTVHETLRIPEVAEAIEAIHAETRESVAHQLQAAATLGLSVLIELAQGRPTEDGTPTVLDVVRRQAASDLLDRCGVTKEAAITVKGNMPPPVVIDVSNLSLTELLDAARKEPQEEGQDDEGATPL